MRVTQGDRTILDVRAKAEPGDDVMTIDYYTQLPQICLSANPTSREKPPAIPATVLLDGTDVAKLVECAVGHPNPNMRNAVLAAVWNHPDSFRRIFQFGLDAPEAYPEIREIVAAALGRRGAALEISKTGTDPLLPRMPLPAHLRDRDKPG
jgi:hypothetical protein